jgi:hypothetical protein
MVKQLMKNKMLEKYAASVTVIAWLQREAITLVAVC